MLLKFRIETRKIKQPRIVVLRLSVQENGKVIEKSLGSFSSKRGYDHIVKQLTQEELYEFENFVKTTNFAKAFFNCSADKLDRFIIKSAPDFKNALFKIWESAKEYNIHFIPEYEMLLATFNRAKIIEQQLAVLTNGKFQALSALGIDITHIHSQKSSIIEDQKLLIAAIENAKSTEELATLFNSIAVKKYQKSPKFKAHHFEYLVSQSEQKVKQPFPKWYYTIAIDALCQMKLNPDTFVSPAIITEHWLRLNKKDSLDKTLSAFDQQFKQIKNNVLCKNMIKASFIKDQLNKVHAVGQGQQLVPSLAINYWLKQWNEKHPNMGKKEIIKAFGKEFPLLAENRFIISMIKDNDA